MNRTSTLVFLLIAIFTVVTNVQAREGGGRVAQERELGSRHSVFAKPEMNKINSNLNGWETKPDALTVEDKKEKGAAPWSLTKEPLKIDRDPATQDQLRKGTLLQR